jgi:hypothetical protein
MRKNDRKHTGNKMRISAKPSEVRKGSNGGAKQGPGFPFVIGAFGVWKGDRHRVWRSQAGSRGVQLTSPMVYRHGAVQKRFKRYLKGLGAASQSRWKRAQASKRYVTGLRVPVRAELLAAT